MSFPNIPAEARAFMRKKAQQEAQGALARGDRKAARRHLRELISLKEENYDNLLNTNPFRSE